MNKYDNPSFSNSEVLDRKNIEKAVNKFNKEGKHSFVLIDFDGFKKINDTYGKKQGDIILGNIMEKLLRSLRKEDVVGKIDGDVFLACLSNVYEIEAIEHLAKHICLVLRITLPNGILLSASLGIVRSKIDGKTFNELFENAKKALLSAKKFGGDCFVINGYSTEEEKKQRLSSYNGTDNIAFRVPRSYKHNILVTYDCQNDIFIYDSPMDKYFSACFDERPLWQIMTEDNLSSIEDSEKFREKILEISKSNQPEVFYTEYFLKNYRESWRWYRVGFISENPHSLIHITFTDINDEIAFNRRLTQLTDYDELTGLLNKLSFCHFIDSQKIIPGEQAVVYFDVLRFKAINDIFGSSEGDRLLIFIADILLQVLKQDGIAGRIGSDRFAFFIYANGKKLSAIIEELLSKISSYDLSFEVVCNMGVYVATEELLSADAMLARASLAQSSIKGRFSDKYVFYKEDMRNEMITEQEIVGMTTSALSENQFVVYYQPQYNHVTGSLIGAEALVRWNHPEKGLIAPNDFIPIFEKNGFITKLDLYVFEQVCKFQKKCLEDNKKVVPISSNFSRYDIFKPNYIDSIEEIRKKYDIPANYLRVEITESAVVGGNKFTNEIVKKLHDSGYIVEMDDFGSGYSSLNVLKDIDFDIVKLDMKFLSENSNSNRSGTILSSIIRMAEWLGMPVIAEGVESISQADFLRSIGCEIIQGYLYSRPLPEEQYYALISLNTLDEIIAKKQITSVFDTLDFWNPKSKESVFFNNYVGAAAIFEYADDKIEFLRINKKYLKELAMNLSEKDLIELNFFDMFDDYNRSIFEKAISLAISTEQEQECETWRTLKSMCCGSEKVCIRSTIRMIDKQNDTFLFYTMIRNITPEKKFYDSIIDNEKRFKIASEQINIYYWEYIVATKEMRPCYRCMRDLGLPAVVKNYPEPAIEIGIFPQDYADMYRDWHKQIENGVKELEAIIPLTPGRVPFRVRYTTEFDANGRPVKAYGSAVLVVDDKDTQRK